MYARSSSTNNEAFAVITVAIADVVVGLLAAAGLIQHMMTCFKHEKVFVFLVGLMIPPIGVLHGWGIWLGLFAS